MKKGLAVFLLFLVTLTMAACTDTSGTGDATSSGTQATTTESQTQEVQIEFKGLETESVFLTLSDVKEYTPVSETVKSKKETDEKQVTGTKLNDILKDRFGAQQTDYLAIKATADDGFEKEIPADVLAESDILIVYQENAKDISEIYICLPDGAEMYWVKNIVSLTFTGAAESSTAAQSAS